MRAAGEAAIGEIAPNPYPANIAAQKGQEAAQGALEALRQTRARLVRPQYAQAAGDTVPAGEMRRVLGELDSLIASNPNAEVNAAARSLRSELIAQGAAGTPATRTPVTDPRTGAFVRYESTPAQPGTPATPRTNVGELDQIYGANRDAFSGPAPLGETGTQARGRRLASQGLGALDTELQAASPSLRTGRQIYADATEQVIRPAEQGPLGRIAATDPGSAGATQSMGRTLAGVGEGDRYASVVSESVKRLSRQDARAAETLARDYIGDVFNRALGDLKTGPDQYGGAGFRAALVGDTASAANVRALVEALPDGASRWAGFQRFLDVMEATAFKPVKGSQTAFNQQAQKELSGRSGLLSGAVEEASKAGLGLKGRLSDAWARYRMGSNTAELANILTNPSAAPFLRQLAKEPAGSKRAGAIALRLSVLGERSVNGGASGE